MDSSKAGADTRCPHRPIAWPVILIALGVLFLLNNLALLSISFWRTLWRFWPIILVLIGIELLFGRSHPWIGTAIAVCVVAAAVALALITSGGVASITVR
jgi:hypothetical protein